MTARMKIGEADDQPKKETRQSINGLLAAGGIIAALGASSCCVVPLALLALGISGAWIGNLTAFAPYQPLFVTAAIGCLAVGFLRVYFPQKASCANGTSCTHPRSSHLTKFSLWVAAVLVTVAVAFPYLARFFLET
ncbi:MULTISPECIES: mercuric transporter MerT family protein [Rhizobium]|nr:MULTISPECIES: mercuric transporter MerT family protein [Rhizobium]